MNTDIQTAPYLPKQRNFPNDNSQELGVELDKSYIDIANRVNERTIGIYAIEYPTITGEKWYLDGQPNKQQTLRQVYEFQDLLPIPHNIDLTQIDRITNKYGDYTDGTNWFGLIAGSNVAIAGQVSFYLDNNNIVFLSGAGAPVPTFGQIVITWLSQF